MSTVDCRWLHCHAYQPTSTALIRHLYRCSLCSTFPPFVFWWRLPSHVADKYNHPKVFCDTRNPEQVRLFLVEYQGRSRYKFVQNLPPSYHALILQILISPRRLVARGGPMISVLLVSTSPCLLLSVAAASEVLMLSSPFLCILVRDTPARYRCATEAAYVLRHDWLPEPSLEGWAIHSRNYLSVQLLMALERGLHVVTYIF
ncbi:unnamed protein product [Somion occarium]|uniref:Uncharacterized protein n=1 Tax=Somion occarium TaxID=3059160 RepID=A0ABP1DT16_9APHY